MKIYCKGISEENIDFIVERKLRAYISVDHAMVTLYKDKRTIEELRNHLGVSETSSDYTGIYFSPEMIIPDMKYIFFDESQKEKFEGTIKDFEQSFFDKVIEIAEQSGNLTRAEVIRLLWNKYTSKDIGPYNGIEEADKKLLEALIDKADDKKWLKDRFLELILKYSTHITCWEMGYGWKSADKYYNNTLGKRGEKSNDSKNPPSESGTLEKWYRYLLDGRGSFLKGRNIEKAKNLFEEGKLENDTISIEDTIYAKMAWDYEEQVKCYRKFFYFTHADQKDTKVSLYGLMLFFNCYRFLWYEANKEEKAKNAFLTVLGCAEHIGDITDVIDKNTTAAIEIVLMCTLKINQDLKKDSKWIEDSQDIIDHVNELELVVLPTTISLLKYQDTTNKDILEVDELMKKYEGENRAEIVKAAKKIGAIKKEKLSGKDGGSVLGNFKVFSSENKEVIYENGNKHEAGKENVLINSAKSKERDYWTQRKKNIMSYEVDFNNGNSKETLRKFLEFLREQNLALREQVRECIIQIL